MLSAISSHSVRGSYGEMRLPVCNSCADRRVIARRLEICSPIGIMTMIRDYWSRAHEAHEKCTNAQAINDGPTQPYQATTSFVRRSLVPILKF